MKIMIILQITYTWAQIHTPKRTWLKMGHQKFHNLQEDSTCLYSLNASSHLSLDQPNFQDLCPVLGLRHLSSYLINKKTKFSLLSFYLSFIALFYLHNSHFVGVLSELYSHPTIGLWQLNFIFLITNISLEIKFKISLKWSHLCLQCFKYTSFFYI